MSGAPAAEYARLWETGDSPQDAFAFLAQHAAAGPAEKLEVLLADPPEPEADHVELLLVGELVFEVGSSKPRLAQSK